MIVVLGSARVREGRLEEALALSEAHVMRSRAEPGCIEHGVSIDSQDPLHLVFVERWESMTALTAHFAVPASIAFVKALSAMLTAPPGMSVYEATQVMPGARGRT